MTTSDRKSARGIQSTFVAIDDAPYLFDDETGQYIETWDKVYQLQLELMERGTLKANRRNRPESFLKDYRTMNIGAGRRNHLYRWVSSMNTRYPNAINVFSNLWTKRSFSSSTDYFHESAVSDRSYTYRDLLAMDVDTVEGNRAKKALEQASHVFVHDSIRDRVVDRNFYTMLEKYLPDTVVIVMLK